MTTQSAVLSQIQPLMDSSTTHTQAWKPLRSKSQQASRFCELPLPFQLRAKLLTRARKLRAVKVGSLLIEEMRATTDMEPHASRFKLRPSSTPVSYTHLTLPTSDLV